jgi:UDP-glucose 4-epimerase
MKSLVTGGCGFIGSTLVDKLLSLGHEVVVIDNKSSEVHESFYNNSKATYHTKDIADYEGTRDIYKGVDYVFHCAAESRIQPAIHNPLLAVKTNTLGTATVLQCAREAGVKRVMYSSTSSAYGLINTPPLNETMPDDCLNPYSVSKVSGEKLCKMYTDLFKLDTIIFRYFNVYGPREPLKGSYAPVVGLFLRQHAENKPLTIVGDGEQRRDFTHVDDVVNANILAMMKTVAENEESPFGKVYNVGTGKNHSVLELARMISKNIEYLPPRPAEARFTLADNSRMKKVFGWEPTKHIDEYIKGKL